MKTIKVKYALTEGVKILAVDTDDKFLYLKYPDEWVKIPLKYSTECEEIPGVGVEEISVIDKNGKTLRKISVKDLLEEHQVGGYFET